MNEFILPIFCKILKMKYILDFLNNNKKEIRKYKKKQLWNMKRIIVDNYPSTPC